MNVIIINVYVEQRENVIKIQDFCTYRCYFQFISVNFILTSVYFQLTSVNFQLTSVNFQLTSVN